MIDIIQMVLPRHRGKPAPVHSPLLHKDILSPEIILLHQLDSVDLRQKMLSFHKFPLSLEIQSTDSVPGTVEAPKFIWLVVFPYPSEKCESQLGSLFPTEWKVIKFMFQTTNQSFFQRARESKIGLLKPLGFDFRIRLLLTITSLAGTGTWNEWKER